jgi:DNA replication protein DnaC
MSSDFAVVIQRCMQNDAALRRRLETDPAFREQELARLARLEETEKQEQRDEIERRRIARGIPRRVWPYLDAGERTKAIMDVSEFMQGPLTLLFLGGGEGPGKTVAACTALDRNAGLFVKAGDVARARKDKAEWDPLVFAHVLVVDDLGASYEDDKGWVAGAFYELIDRRYDALGKTIVTCNLTAKAFRQHYCNDGGRLAGRIREAGVFIELDGESMRGRPRAPDGTAAS